MSWVSTRLVVQYIEFNWFHVVSVDTARCVYSTVHWILNWLHVVSVDTDTYNVAFWMSNAWLIGGGCGLDLISQNQRCNALSTCGRNDSRLRLVLSTLPSSTMPFNLLLCFFHVEIVDWLKLYCLHRSMAFTPQSNLFNISIFSLSVRAVCCLFSFSILIDTRKRKLQHFI